MSCKICGENIESFSRALLMEKYDVEYFQCRSCGFICTEEPYWLEESYSTAITKSDLGLVNRNIHLSKIAKSLITFFFNRNGRFLDYAGGYGLFVRLMRDLGFDFRWNDKYCQNIFAFHFESYEEDNLYEILTAFEVLEHLNDPINELDHMLRFSRNILFTTVLVPEPSPKPCEWWYYGLGHGQHISFFTYQTLEIMARKFSLNLVSDGKSCHMLTEKRIPRLLFQIISSFQFAFIIDLLSRRKSLLLHDYKSIARRI